MHQSQGTVGSSALCSSWGIDNYIKLKSPLACKQYDSFLRKDFGDILTKVVDARIAASASVSAVRFDLLAAGRPLVKVDVQSGLVRHLGSRQGVTILCAGVYI